MWVYDGERWLEEDGAGDSKVVRPTPTAPELPVPREQFVPELQVVEVVPTPKTNYVPPFPLP